MYAHFPPDDFAVGEPIVDYDPGEIIMTRAPERWSVALLRGVLIDTLDPVVAVYEPVNG